jgi:Tol biopolymer transport system component
MSDGQRGSRGSAPGRLSTLLSAVLELPPDERERWIDESSGGNAGLRAQLREMLRAAQADSERPRGEDTEFLESSGTPQPGSGGSGRGSTFDGPAGARLVLGQQLGRYQVLDLLGAGGMGRVYRALDATLDREVAIKGLADAFRGDSRSLRRFEREARVLATLSHPNIAAIYGLERLDGSPYLVLERVDGETLAQRLVRGPVPVDEALAIAAQIIAGLEEAHAKGVIHRDLKPSNVMLTPARQVKLVDFGLAKTASVRSDPDESVEPITEIGLVVGTARYMSPEQVTGADVDTRTDVWAFGCVLYEMLTARPVFSGRSVSEVAAAVLRDEPDWTLLPAGVPRGVVRLIRRCLRRDPRTRLQHIGDARVELSDLELDTERSGVVVARRGPSRPIVWAVAAGALVAAVGSGLLLLRPREQAAAPAVRLSLELPSPVALATEFSAPFALSPSGSRLAIEASEGGLRRLYVRELRDPGLRRLAGTEGARQPFFSPDGRWIGFFTERKVAKVPAEGGPVLEVADVGGNHRGATWAADGSMVIAASQTSGLLRIRERGGPAEPLTTLDRARGEYSHRWPEALPGSPWVIFTVGLEDATFDEGRIDAVSLETGERRTLVTGAGFARYLPGRGLLFVRGGRVYAVGFDLERLTVIGTPDVLLDAVRYDWRNGGSHLAASASGLLVYTPGEPVSHEYYLSWVGRDGRIERTVETPRRFRDLRRRTDGGRVAVVLGSSADADLWSIDPNGTLSRLSFGLAPFRPTWRPDGRAITVGAQKDGRWRILTVPADGTGETFALLESANRMYPDTWTPDGRHLIFQENGAATGWDLKSLEVDHAGRVVGTPKPFAPSPFQETNAAFSPDGRWVAYESDELDGVVQIYVRAWPDGSGKVLASTGGARWPAWGANGELYYWQTGEGMLRVIRTREHGGALTVGAAEAVWANDVAPEVLRRIVITTPNARFDVDPRTSRFLVLEKARASTAPDLRSPIVVLGLDSDRRAGAQ